MQTNDAEQLVAEICEQTYFKLWCYRNPQGKDSGKELCDVLVVCDPDIVIFSVKDIIYKDTGRPDVDAQRWRTKAIDSSAKQLYGAERQIGLSEHVIRADGQKGLPFPSQENRQVHRVSVSLGSKGKVPVTSGDFGGGFVHVLDEVSLRILLGELDTITDFTRYLRAREELFGQGIKEFASGSEVDVLAVYLRSGDSFPTDVARYVRAGRWEELTKNRKYLQRKRAEQEGYPWDRLIEVFCNDYLADHMEFPAELTNMDRVVRTLAREDRYSRNGLGPDFMEWYMMGYLAPHKNWTPNKHPSRVGKRCQRWQQRTPPNPSCRTSLNVGQPSARLP